MYAIKIETVHVAPAMYFILWPLQVARRVTTVSQPPLLVAGGYCHYQQRAIAAPGPYFVVYYILSGIRIYEALCPTTPSCCSCSSPTHLVCSLILQFQSHTPHHSVTAADQPLGQRVHKYTHCAHQRNSPTHCLSVRTVNGMNECRITTLATVGHD